MRICCVSDLHGSLPQVESCDLLVIAGDICGHVPTKKTIRFGKELEWLPPVGQHDDVTYQAGFLNGPFREWLNLIPANDVVATPGNHDFVFERARVLVPTDLRWHLLIDDVKVIQGKKIYGSPWQHAYGHGWVFNAPPRDDGGEEWLDRKYSMIPDDTDIFVVHGPPYSMGDAALRWDGAWEMTGSTSLMAAIMRIKPDLSVHGHIHLGHGIYPLGRGNKKDTIVVNASICDEQNEPIRQPLYFEI